MINYIAQLVPNLTVMQPLHNLLKKDAEFMWSMPQEKALSEVADLVSKASVLNLYVPIKELLIENDASGSVMPQDKQPIACARRVLSEAENNMRRQKKRCQLLQALYGLEKFHLCTLGRAVTVTVTVTIVTDHKPLVAINATTSVKSTKQAAESAHESEGLPLYTCLQAW